VLNGRLIRNSARRQFVTQKQVLSMLREHGIEDVARVKAAFIEGSG
jgi:uncharacterized membrane protein YcaP (DUF421 family)